MGLKGNIVKLVTIMSLLANEVCIGEDSSGIVPIAFELLVVYDDPGEVQLEHQGVTLHLVRKEFADDGREVCSYYMLSALESESDRRAVLFTVEPASICGELWSTLARVVFNLPNRIVDDASVIGDGHFSLYSLSIEEGVLLRRHMEIDNFSDSMKKGERPSYQEAMNELFAKLATLTSGGKVLASRLSMAEARLILNELIRRVDDSKMIDSMRNALDLFGEEIRPMLGSGSNNRVYIARKIDRLSSIIYMMFEDRHWIRADALWRFGSLFKRLEKRWSRSILELLRTQYQTNRMCIPYDREGTTNRSIVGEKELSWQDCMRDTIDNYLLLMSK